VPAILTPLTRNCCLNNNKQWFSKELGKISIKVMHHEKGYRAKKKFIKKFPNKNWSDHSHLLISWLTQTDQTGTVDRKASSGKKFMARIAWTGDSVEALVLNKKVAKWFVRLCKRLWNSRQTVADHTWAKLLCCKLHIFSYIFEMLIKLTLIFFPN